jgi:hypothetical protein
MHDNDRHAAPVASRSRRALILVAAAISLLVPLAGCEIEPMDLNLDFDDSAYGEVQVNVSATKTSVGACVSRGLFGPFFGPCKGPEDGFSFQAADNQWHYAPETVATMPEGTPLAVYWKGPEGQTSFEVSLPPVIAITAPAADAQYRMSDTVSLEWPDLGSDEITVENQGSCVGDDPAEWRRVVPSENAKQGRLDIRATDLVEAVPPFERCDITLRVTAKRQGTFSSSIAAVTGQITASTTAEVTIQIVP